MLRHLGLIRCQVQYKTPIHIMLGPKVSTFTNNATPNFMKNRLPEYKALLHSMEAWRAKSIFPKLEMPHLNFKRMKTWVQLDNETRPSLSPKCQVSQM